MCFHRFYGWYGAKTSEITSQNKYLALNRMVNKTRKITRVLEYKAAGSVFTNGTHILAAQQPNKNPPMISGFGGSRESDEIPLYTAIRETLEELFNLIGVPKGLIENIIKSVPCKKVIKNKSYVFGIYDFKDLEKMLLIVKKYGIKSPLYKQFPVNLSDLLLKRIIDPSAELTQLALLPLVDGLKIDPNLLEDIPQIIARS